MSHVYTPGSASEYSRLRLSLIDEKKRKKQKHVSELELRKKGGVRNIKAIYNEADEAERDYWGDWYYTASDDVRELAIWHGIDEPVVAAVVATLSPGNKWLSNIKVADKVIEAWKAGKPAEGLAAYPKNVEKAYRILDANDEGLVRGPKVSVFYNSLVEPEEIQHDIVLDSHAINIWLGRKVPLKQTPTISDSLRERIKADYAKAAAELGVSPQALQATTWYIWKYTTTKKPSVKKAKKSAKGKRRIHRKRKASEG
jgi:hypothetical protein